PRSTNRLLTGLMHLSSVWEHWKFQCHIMTAWNAKSCRHRPALQPPSAVCAIATLKIRRGAEHMSVIIKMPAISPSMTAGKLVCWHFSVGDKVKQGDVIAELETDKAVMDIEAPEDGVLEQILVEGDTPDVPV